jgi:hypothetical protein
MKKASIISLLLGVIGLLLFTGLLITRYISEFTYLGLLIPLALVCVAVLCLPRLKELDLKNLRMTLSEIKQIKSEIETAKADIEEMYGGIEKIQNAPMVLDEAKRQELGLMPSDLAATATMRYTTGCIKRERERLARIFISPKEPDKLAKAILDASLDDKVFKWNGPETPLDTPPVSGKEREKRRKEKEQTSQST